MLQSPILIIGKHAKTGWRVDSRLRDLGYSTRPVSRSTTPAFDWEDQSTWRTAMAGTQSAYITFHPDLAVPSAEQTIRDFVGLAIELGLKHLVLLSGRGEEGARRAEIVIEESGLDWNIVRSSWFMQNFSENFMVEGIINGELMLPAGDIAEPFIDVDDIAEVVASLLHSARMRNQVVEVSGPRAMTFKECTDSISEVTGYPVRFTQVPIDSFLDALRDQQTPESLIWLMRELFTVVFDGRNSIPVSGVEDVLGRPATDFTEYLTKVMETGTWNRSDMRQSA